MDTLDRWMQARLIHIRTTLDALDRTRALDIQKEREAELYRQYEHRGGQWYVATYGVGHNRPDGVRRIDAQPEFYAKLV